MGFPAAQGSGETWEVTALFSFFQVIVGKGIMLQRSGGKENKFGFL